MKKKIVSLLLVLSLCIFQTGMAGGSALTARAESAQLLEGEQQVKTSFTAVDDSIAEDKWKLILNQPARFHRMTFTDRETGLYVHYNIYLPEKYDKTASYPLVLFLADVNSTGTNPELPLAQGIGGLVWTTDEWQSQFPCIVAVPLYREQILDHLHGYTTTGYIELTKNFVGYLCEEYAVDRTRVYGTGQGMGCEALMTIAADSPKLFTACMFVSGQWNADKLTALEEQKFICFAAEDDKGAYRFTKNLMNRFAADGVSYAYSMWDGSWDPETRTLSTLKLTTSRTGHYFVLWNTGTVIPDNDDLKRAEGLTMINPGVHVASFNCAYRCIAVLEWLFSQATQIYDTVR